MIASPLPIGAGRVIVAPFQFYTDGAESLRFEVWNSVTGVTVALQGRWFSAKGGLQTFARTIAPTADRVRNRLDIPLEVGYLVTLAAFASSGTPRIGHTYVKVSLIRGLTGATMLVGQLLGGYVTAEQALGWPGSPIVDSISSGGAVRFIIGTNPAAGAEASELVPTGARWQLLTFGITLTTDATAADRRAQLIADDVTRSYVLSTQSGTQPATTGKTWFWSAGAWLDTDIFSISTVAGWPVDIPLLAGHRVRTSTSNLQAGDNYDAPALVVREWLEVDA